MLSNTLSSSRYLVVQSIFNMTEYYRVNDRSDLIINSLRLSVTRTWGQRTLKTSSKEWKELRNTVLKRDNNSCKFCCLQSMKYMVCDHINGKAFENDLSNLRILCPLCDMIRHCGRAGIFGQLKLYSSEMNQVQIVQKSINYFRQKGKIPDPLEIDNKAILISPTTTLFANVLLKKDYDQLNEEEKSYKGFFSDKALPTFKKLIKVEMVSDDDNYNKSITNKNIIKITNSTSVNNCLIEEYDEWEYINMAWDPEPQIRTQILYHCELCDSRWTVDNPTSSFDDPYFDACDNCWFPLVKWIRII